MTRHARRRRHLISCRVAVGAIVGVCLSILLAGPGRAFVAIFDPDFPNYSAIWPDARVVMNLQLGCTGGQSFIAGGTCWDDWLSSALAEWNSVAKVFEFRQTSTPANACAFRDTQDGLNTVHWSSTFCGVFNIGDAGALAVGTYTRVPGTSDFVISEQDVLFNTNFGWNVYFGPVIPDSTGTQYILDLRRFALHEFGHVLGLDHPDEFGQTVPSVMESVLTDLDSLQWDDVAGVNALYPRSGVSRPPTLMFDATTVATFVRNTAPSSIRNTFVVSLQETNPFVGGTFGSCTVSGSPVTGAANVGNCQWNIFTDRGVALLRFSFNFRLPGTSGHWGEFVLVNTRGFGQFARFWRPAGGTAVSTASGRVAWE